MNEVVFYPSRVKMMVFSLAAFLAGIFCIYMAYIAFTDPAEKNWFLGIISALLVIIVLSASYGLFKKTINKEAGVIINDIGITINVHTPKIGLIPWEDIEGCLLYSAQGQPTIGIVIHNEEEYVNKFNGVNKALLVGNQKLGNPAINIGLTAIKDKKGLLEALEERNVNFFEKDII